MKQKITLITILVLSTSCSNISSKSNKEILETNVRVIDDCEYLEFENASSGSQNYNYTITHKGNCKNPIHYQ